MNSFRILNLAALIAVFILCMFSASLPANTPSTEIKATIDSIMNILNDDNLKLSSNKAKRRSLIRSLITDRFDFVEMAKRSLARHWRERSPEEKQEFVSLFSELLEASYIGKIESYTSEKITYDKEILKGGNKYGVVSTSIITKDVTIPIDYKVIQRNNAWRVYDVVIEGVSFISTYRSQYNTIIKQKSFSHLIQTMQSKLIEVNAELQ
jgi:phospholipid transport system substrate-binding protein